MKKYALCSENKKCAICGAQLKLFRKSASWYSESTKVRVDRPTNIYSCKSCRLDHVMKGFHIDELSWNHLLLPIETEPSRLPKQTQNKSSKVTTYTVPNYIKQQKVESLPIQPPKIIQNPPKQSINVSRETSLYLRKKEKGIKLSTSNSNHCGNCDFYNKHQYCPIHMLNTEHNEVCSRFKHYFKREVSAGLYSPK
jgi:hypothetical protein